MSRTTSFPVSLHGRSASSPAQRTFLPPPPLPAEPAYQHAGSPPGASSSLMIMTLGAKCGDTVEVAGDDQAAVDAVAALVAQDLDAA